MIDNKNKLFLFEALELRAELDARIKTFKDCLPEARKLNRLLRRSSFEITVDFLDE